MHNNNASFLLGSLVVMIVAFVFAFLNTNYDFLKKDDCFLIIAKFNNVLGLAVGGDVKTSGVSVGEIKSIEFDELGKVVVSLCITKNLNIPEDTVASISFDNLLSGTKFIDLELGQEKSFLSSGQSIDMTRSSINLESIIRQFMTSNY